MSSLAKILFEFSEVMEKIEENNGEITDELVPVISHVELQISQKVDSYVNFCDAVKAQVERTKKIIENFKSSLKTLENLESRLKDNVKHTMLSHNLLEIRGEERSIKILNAGGVAPTEKPHDLFYSLDCVDTKYQGDLHEYIEKVTVFVLKDKEKFKEAIKQNKVPHCMVLPRSKYVKFA